MSWLNIDSKHPHASMEKTCKFQEWIKEKENTTALPSCDTSQFHAKLSQNSTEESNSYHYILPLEETAWNLFPV